MNKRIILTMTAALIVGAGISSQAADATTLTLSRADDDSNPVPSTGEPIYRANEFSLEGYGFLTLNEYTLNHLLGQRVERNGSLGLGAGAEYFFCRYVGVEAEGFSESIHHSFVDDFGGNLVLRLPIGESGFAPYAFGGGGHRADPEPGTYADGGAGVEYRFNPHVGIFIDARWVLPDKVHDFAMGRLGFRFAF
jgi:hypothetical protein